MAHRNAPIVDAIRERIWSECDAAAILAAGDQAPALVRELATSFLREERYVVGSGRTDTIVESVVAATLGLGPLEPLLADPEVAEIMVNGPHNVFIERRGQIERVDVQFHDDEHVRQVIDRILAPISRRLDALSPMVDARLPDGSRVNAIIPPLAVEGPALTIRRFLDVARTVDDLQRLGAFPPDGARTLRSLVSDRANVLVAGATSSGKTTLLAAALAECDERDRIIVIEDSAELSIDRPHRIRLEARAASFETHGEVRVRDLVKNALRMRPDRLVVGEVRGSEAFDLVQAMSTGHRGSWATVHANGPDDAMLRVEAMALAAGIGVPQQVIRAQLSRAFDAIVFVRRAEGGARLLESIVGVVPAATRDAGWLLEPIWQRESS